MKWFVEVAEKDWQAYAAAVPTASGGKVKPLVRNGRVQVLPLAAGFAGGRITERESKKLAQTLKAHIISVLKAVPSKGGLVPVVEIVQR